MSDTKPLADQSAREAIRDALEQTLVVEAAAGTGKTTALVGRIVQVIERGRGELAKIVAVTFTEKAAGELKLRLRSELERARNRHRAEGNPEPTSRLERGLMQLEEAHIGTIHGFCADILKQRPLLAGVDPLFEVATEEQTQRIYARVFDRWLSAKLSDPPPGVRRILRKQAFREEGPIDELYRAGWALLDVRDFPAPWQPRHFEREGEIDDLVERLLPLAESAQSAASDRDYLLQDFEALLGFVQDLRSQEQVSGKRDYDALEHQLPAIKLGKRKGRGFYGEGISREELLAEREALRETLADFKKRAGADLAAFLHEELRELVEPYQASKVKRGVVDFLDLLVSARDLIRDHPEVRAELQSSFSHLFVDEFQDTDPLQAEILLLLSADDPDQNDWRQVRPVQGKLFIVADPKQSIYRFRRADVALYQRIKKQLVASGAKPVYLTVSFRSVPALQEIVNAAMFDAMKPTASNHQADYVALDQSRESIPDQPSIVALPVPRPYSNWGYLTQFSIRDSEPGAVAAWIRWLVEESGWRVTSRGETEARPVEPSDVCLLFRRFRSSHFSVTQPYVEALQGLDVPHVLVGGRGFHQREEIEAMRVALTAIERPDDDLSVFATLRGPLFALSDDSLFLYRARHGSLHPFLDPGPNLVSEDASVRGAMDVLSRLHKGRNHRPIAFTIRELLDATRSQAGFALWQAGDQVLANVLRLLQLARNFEESGGLSFRGFVQHLDTLAAATERQEQPLIEDGVEGVRLMTVHKAKGLEFPVVILCDITCSFSLGASRHVDPDRKLFAMRLGGHSPWELLDHEESESERDAAESLRLLYVAATRARDLLVVPVVADEPHERGWVGPLLKALYPNPRAYRLPMVSASCPRFPGDECVLDRPARARTLPGQGIRPGLHKPMLGRHEVVWWDPSLFELDMKTKPGLRRHWILQAPSEPGAERESSPGAEEHLSWSREREERVDRAAAPTYRVDTVTRLVERGELELAGASKIDVLEVSGRDRNRPSGKRFGSLVHEVLARTPLETSHEALAALAASLGRVLGNPLEEIDAAARAVSRALEHSLFEGVRRARECHRETPLVHRDPKGVLVDGVPDLVFRESSQEPWTVVDFKTDLRAELSQDSYRQQVALYVEAVSRATGHPARGRLFYL